MARISAAILNQEVMKAFTEDGEAEKIETWVSSVLWKSYASYDCIPTDHFITSVLL